MKFKTLKAQMLQTDPGFRDEYLARDLALELGHLIAYSRLKKGITQERLANMIGTKQPSVARAEAGRVLPSIAFLNRIAERLGMNLVIDFRDSETHTLEFGASVSGYVKSPIQQGGMLVTY